MDRVNGPGEIVSRPGLLRGVREMLALALVSLATRLAPLTTETQTASIVTGEMRE